MSRSLRLPSAFAGVLSVSCLAGLPSCGGSAQSSSPGPPPAGIAIASDSTGMKLVVVGGDVWTSTDGGATWIDRTPLGPAHGQSWTSVASDASGTNLVAVVNGFYDTPSANPEAFSGDVWTSTDGGATWTDRTASSDAHGLVWRSVASDATGKSLVAVASSAGVVVASGGIWTSVDAGATWTDRTAENTAMGSQGWKSVASDSTGTNLVAVGMDGLWTSIDGGATWTDRTPNGSSNLPAPGGQGWSSVASDATGTKLAAVVDTGDIWTSADGGGTWNDRGDWEVWFSVASDATGTNLVAVDALVDGQNGDIWTSSDGGQTWTDLTTGNAAASGPWTAATSNATGDHLVVIGNGSIWTE